MLTCGRALWRGGSQQKSPGNWSLLPSVKVDWALRVQRCGTAHALLSCCGFILFKTDSIWVEWMHQNVIKDSTIWEIKEKQSHTWVFKQILRLGFLLRNGFEFYLVMGRHVGSGLIHGQTFALSLTTLALMVPKLLVSPALLLFTLSGLMAVG